MAMDFRVGNGYGKGLLLCVCPPLNCGHCGSSGSVSQSRSQPRHHTTSEVMDVEVVSLSPPVQPILSAEAMDAVEAAEGTAKNALESLFLECTERGQDRLVDDAVAHVKSALDSLTESGRHMTASANALLAMGRALSAIPPTPDNTELAERVTEVECKVRDVAVWRCCQKSVPIDSRVAFIEKLKEAFGDAFLDKNLQSRLMHAHKNAVSAKVATTILSNTQQACIKHGRTRGDRRVHGSGVAAEKGVEVVSDFDAIG